MDREEMDNIWDSFYYTPDIHQRIKDNAAGLVEFLMTSLLMEDEIEIGLFSNPDGTHGSMVTYDVYNDDKVLSIRYKNDTSFELHIELENDEGELRAFDHALSEREVDVIPEGLQILMKKAFDTNDAMVWKPNTIQK